MEQKYGFTKLSAAEFSQWLATQSISRTCLRVQQHHTWKPRYSSFSGNNHFTLQNNMKRFHMNHNGWSDIGQHFTIFPDGAIVTGRRLNSSPACIYKANSGAICIENLGNFDTGGDTMNAAQADSIFSTTAALLKKIGISTPSRTNVVYHHWYNGSGKLVYHNSGQKSCPGTAFFGGNQLNDFEANFLPRLKSAMSSGGVSGPVGLQQWARVASDTLNIRTGPGSSFKTIGDHGPLHYGSVIRVYETSASGWYRISQTKQYWVYGRYTQPVREAVVNTVDTNVRIGPDTAFAIETIYQPGDRVFVIRTKGSWCQVDDDQWIHSSLLNII
ncbi:N-acetylmuramoyl-L-alanine amidase [Coralliovum pocilloporae]|uniref:N-acetylmuramoyl-L-alanine amidase n=1 Tax=Coralliovum pocilloporae TaxID=3066369 RepID=UPI003307700C